MAALTADNVLLWIHGRRLGLLGDMQSGSTIGLVVDNIVFGASLPSGRGLIQQLGGTALVGSGSVPLTGAQVGDRVLSVFDLTAHTNITADFESTISVLNAIQQTTGAAADPILVLLQPQS